MSYLPLKAYYNNTITNEHRTGDVWINLPSYGLLGMFPLSGVVITPACDLANEKVETITYLPIIPIRKYLASRCFITEIKHTLLGLAESIKYNRFKDIVNTKWPPASDDIEGMLKEVTVINKNGKYKEKSKRFLFLLNYLYDITIGKNFMAEINNLSEAIGNKYFDNIIRKMITNSYRNDMHFVPADGQNPSWSAILEHSLILFRYPLTSHIDVFNLAQRTTEFEWDVEINALSKKIQIAREFIEHKPLKVLRISETFLHDMLNRFVALYSRLGSPDFTSMALERIENDLRK